MHGSVQLVAVAVQQSSPQRSTHERARLIEMGKQTNQNQRTHPAGAPFPLDQRMEGRDGRHQARPARAGAAPYAGASGKPALARAGAALIVHGPHRMPESRDL
jgi:hypothetical protein